MLEIILSFSASVLRDSRVEFCPFWLLLLEKRDWLLYSSRYSCTILSASY
jgi:hypothetical protein